MPLNFSGRLAKLIPSLRQRYVTALAYRHVFGTAQGKEVLRDLFAFCGDGRDLQALDNNGRTDEFGTHINVGKHRVKQRIIAFLNFNEAAVERLLAQQDRASHENQQEASQ